MSRDAWGENVRSYGAPDEEEEWSPPPRPARAAPTPDGPREPAGPEGSLVGMRLGPDRLPTQIALGKNWHRAVAPSDYGRSVFAEYKARRMRQTLADVEAGRAVGALPTRRQRLTALLRATTYQQLLDMEDKLLSYGRFTGRGRGETQWGQPAVLIEADRCGISSVIIDPEWAQERTVFDVQGELMDAVRDVREQIADFTPDGGESNLDDDELALRVQEHRTRLARRDNE